jgi:hypothetical protein
MVNLTNATTFSPTYLSLFFFFKGLDGFSIRYVWKAHVESPFEPSLSSEEVLCQFMPYVLAPKPLEWTYREVVGAVMTKSTTQVNKPPTGIDVSIKMHQQVYVPGIVNSLKQACPHEIDRSLEFVVWLICLTAVLLS